MNESELRTAVSYTYHAKVRADVGDDVLGTVERQHVGGEGDGVVEACAIDLIPEVLLGGSSSGTCSGTGSGIGSCCGGGRGEGVGVPCSDINGGSGGISTDRSRLGAQLGRDQASGQQHTCL